VRYFRNKAFNRFTNDDKFISISKNFIFTICTYVVFKTMLKAEMVVHRDRKCGMDGLYNSTRMPTFFSHILFLDRAFLVEGSVHRFEVEQ